MPGIPVLWLCALIFHFLTLGGESPFQFRERRGEVRKVLLMYRDRRQDVEQEMEGN